MMTHWQISSLRFFWFNPKGCSQPSFERKHRAFLCFKYHQISCFNQARFPYINKSTCPTKNPRNKRRQSQIVLKPITQKTNISPKKGPFQKESIFFLDFQPLFFCKGNSSFFGRFRLRYPNLFHRLSWVSCPIHEVTWAGVVGPLPNGLSLPPMAYKIGVTKYTVLTNWDDPPSTFFTDPTVGHFFLFGKSWTKPYIFVLFDSTKLGKRMDVFYFFCNLQNVKTGKPMKTGLLWGTPSLKSLWNALFFGTNRTKQALPSLKLTFSPLKMGPNHEFSGASS